MRKVHTYNSYKTRAEVNHGVKKPSSFLKT